MHFFATRGQQILGPRKKVGGEEVVKEMFKAAKE